MPQHPRKLDFEVVTRKDDLFAASDALKAGIRRPKLYRDLDTERLVTWRQVNAGVARSNYFSDHAAPGGWRETILGIDPKTAMTILDRIATKRKPI